MLRFKQLFRNALNKVVQVLSMFQGLTTNGSTTKVNGSKAVRRKYGVGGAASVNFGRRRRRRGVIGVVVTSQICFTNSQHIIFNI